MTSKQVRELLAKQAFGTPRCFDFGQKIKRKLTAENLAFNRLEVQQLHGLLLQFIDWLPIPVSEAGVMIVTEADSR